MDESPAVLLDDVVDLLLDAAGGIHRAFVAVATVLRLAGHGLADLADLVAQRAAPLGLLGPVSPLVLLKAANGVLDAAPVVGGDLVDDPGQ